MNLSKEEMQEVNGGGLSVWGIVGLGALFVFLAGAIDGFARPMGCN